MNILSLKIPALRDRREDIVPLAYHILVQLSRTWNINYEEFKQRINNETWKQLLTYSWPGNIPELANVLSRIVLLEDNSAVLNQLKSTLHL
ncbi:hypothetical protein [Gimesia maris]